MCVVSMIFDHYNDRFPRGWQDQTDLQKAFRPFAPQPELAEMRQLIAEFREALEAAKRIDVLTKQPDCHDPEKAKLEERVAALERRLNEMGAKDTEGFGGSGVRP